MFSFRFGLSSRKHIPLIRTSHREYYPWQWLQFLRDRPFRVLEITTIATCPVNCAKYCPQDKLGLAYAGQSLLSFHVFKEALSRVPRDVEICFAGYGEPLLNPQCKDMILYAHEEGHPVTLFSTLSNIKFSTWNAINHVPFKAIIVHLPDAEGITKIRITPDYLAVLEDLKARPRVQFMSMAEIPHEIRKVLPDYKYSFTSNERAGNCEGVQPTEKRGRLFCSKLNHNSTAFVLLPDGGVTLCCMDYGLRHRIGNLLVTDYDDLYDSPEMQKIVKATKTDADPYPLCRTCTWAKSSAYSPEPEKGNAYMVAPP